MGDGGSGLEGQGSTAKPGGRPRLAPALLAGVAAFLLLLPGAGLPYWDRDESEYALVASGMARTGDFLVPRLQGRLYPDKPPLTEWLSALSFRLLGENERAGRLPQLLLAAGSVALLCLLGQELFGDRRAFLAAMAFATSLLPLVCLRLILTDTAVLFFTLAAILALLRVLRGPPSSGSVLLGGVALGLAVMAKGPIACLAPALFATGWASAKRPGRPATVRVLSLFALGVLTALPWYLLAARATGGASLRRFLFRENLSRFFHPMEHHGGPVFYFLPVLVLGFFPWTGFLLASLFRKETLSRDPARRALLAWAGGVFLFFSLAATKLPTYLLPAFPALFLLVAREPESRSGRRVIAWTTAAVGALLLLAVSAGLPRLAEPGAQIGTFLAFAFLALFALAQPLLEARGRFSFAVLALALAGAAALALLAPRALDRARCWSRLGSLARLDRLAGEPVGGPQQSEPAFRYYLGDRTSIWPSRADLVAAALSSPTRSALVFLADRDASALARDRRVRLAILGRGLNAIEPGLYGPIELCRVKAREKADVSATLARRSRGS